MTRNLGTIINNNLSKGLITEATGLNFPDNAVTDALNAVFHPIGYAERRKGFDVEGEAETVAYQDSDGLIKEFVWEAVAKTGGFTFLVLQIGSNVNFYELTQDEALSAGIQVVSLNLEDYKAPGSGIINMTPCTFASGAGYLFVAHPLCDPVIVRWNAETEDFEAARIPIRIRDFEGVDDGLGIAENPGTLTDEHHYNLLNQGWNQMVRVGTVNNELGEGGPIHSEPEPPLDWETLS